MSEIPPPSVSTSTREAPASKEFSISSLTAEAGRSMTSPAAIRCATSGARNRTRPAYSTASSATSSGKRLTPLAREVLDALGFEAAEDLASPVRHLRWQPGQPRYVDAVGGGLGTLL